MADHVEANICETSQVTGYTVDVPHLTAHYNPSRPPLNLRGGEMLPLLR